MFAMRGGKMEERKKGFGTSSASRSSPNEKMLTGNKDECFESLLTGWMFSAASLRTSVRMVSKSLLTSLSNTVWLRTATPLPKRWRAAASVTQVISRGWLKWVCRLTLLPTARPALLSSISASAHESCGSRIREGHTASPLLANRMRSICGMARSRRPMPNSCVGSRL